MLLEYRGCHGIARICYVAPYGCDDGLEYVNEAKAVVAMLGGIEALISLLKRVNRRYQDIVTGKTATANAPGYAGSASAGFQKDMGTLESQQDAYFVLFAALLNVSVLRSVRPLVARKGLQVSAWRAGSKAGRSNMSGLDLTWNLTTLCCL